LAAIDRDATLEWLQDFAALLDTTGVTAALIGGQARNFWAEPRMTRDFDFTVRAERGPVLKLIDELHKRGYVSEREQGDDLASGPDFARLVNPVSGDAIDIQSAKTPYQDELLRRAQKLEPSQLLSVATPEDVIVLKLIAYRPKDIIDLAVLGVIEGLDWRYVEHWAGVWSVSSKLEGLRQMLANDAANNATP
jgi:hypothetical protein